MKKDLTVTVLMVGAVIFLIHSLVGGLGLHQNFFLPALSWKGSLIIGIVALTTCQFWVIDPIWRKKV